MSASISTHSGRTGKRKPKRFAPLDSNATHGGDLPKLKGIVFDVDGTLCLPQNYMFKEMREALGIPKSVDILDHIRSLSKKPDRSGDFNSKEPDPSKLLSLPSDSTPLPEPASPQSRAVAAIQGIERRAMTSQRPQAGLQQLMAYLHRRGMPKALCTRNFPAPVHHLLDTFLRDPEEFGTFEPIITRDSEGIAPKPSPEGIWRIAEHWGIDRDISASDAANDGGDFDPLEVAKRCLGSGLIMVGDSIDDMAAAYRAGAATVLLANDENEHLVGHEFTGRSVRRLDELIAILEGGFEEDT